MFHVSCFRNVFRRAALSSFLTQSWRDGFMFQMFQERVLLHRRCTTDCAQERALTKNEQNAALLTQQCRTDEAALRWRFRFSI
jgi:hypothetical protein